ncbi:MAG: DUF5615 family PIN-like protein [Acidobacteria bacterium]|nr:DUF5615 family PIN-like protein [Acidobacteriota bacterium]
MSRFLIDENLPVKVNVWRGSEFEFVTSSFQSESDDRIWDHAKANDLTIVTKDSDFSYRILASAPPPKVIHLRLGNVRLREFADIMEKRWKSIILLSKTHKLVNVLPDRLEGVE